MYKKIIAITLMVAVLICNALHLFSISKAKESFITPDATKMNLQSCRFAQYAPTECNFQKNRLCELTDYCVLLENDNLAVYYNEKRQNIRVLEKESGYIWGGITEEDRDYLNSQWLEMADSLVTITYLDSQSMSYQSSISSEDFSCEYEAKGNEVLFTADNINLGITFGFRLVLNENSLQIKMEKSSLVESGDYVLESLYFLPFFGAVRENLIDGYMFVPDGPGALIRYAPSTKYISPYTARVYGNDMAVDELKRVNNLMAKRTNDYLTDQIQVTLPVFGVSHGYNENAFLAVIDNGADYADLYASPAGFITDFNYVTAKFRFRETYHLSGGTGSTGIVMNQEMPNFCIPSVSYYFLNGDKANYSGMANTYRSVLENEGVLNGTERKDDSIPLRIDALGGDIKPGKIFNHFVSFTSISQAEDIYNSITKHGINNLSFVYKGWKSGGLNGANYDSTKLSEKLGSKEQLSRLNKKVGKKGRFYLAVNPITANKDQIDYKSEGILNQSKSVVYFQRDNSSITYPLTYILKPIRAVDVMKNFIGKYSDYSLNFNEVGTRAYGDYSRDKVILRNQTIQVFSKTLSKIKKSCALNCPNLYMWQNTDEYFDLPLENSQYFYETDTIPFIPMLLKGSIDYYTPYINQGYYTEDYILKMIEYGAYPSFLVMAETNEKLTNTPSEDYFSLNYNDWESSILTAYAKMNDILSKTEGLKMLNHNTISNGVVRVDYSGNVCLIINYTNDEFRTESGLTVAAKDCALIGEK